MKIVINESVDKLLKSPIRQDIIIGMMLIEDQFLSDWDMLTYFKERKEEYDNLWWNISIMDFWADRLKY